MCLAVRPSIQSQMALSHQSSLALMPARILKASRLVPITPRWTLTELAMLSTRIFSTRVIRRGQSSELHFFQRQPKARPQPLQGQRRFTTDPCMAWRHQCASVPFGSSSPKPTPVALSPSLPNTMTGRGVTQKYVGDLFIVDNFDNQVLRAPYAVPFAAQSTFINSNLNGPVGLATAVTTTLNPVTGVFVPNSNFFVANSNSSK